jgi:hypothetical protein
MKSILLGIIGFLIASSTMAQSLLDPLDIQVIIEPTTDIVIEDNVADTLIDILDIMSDTDPMLVKLSLNVQDTVNVSTISIKVGRTLGGNDVIENTFTMDNNSPGNGYTYEREGLIVTLGAGNHTDVETLFYEVYFEDANSAASQVITGSTE